MSPVSSREFKAFRRDWLYGRLPQQPSREPLPGEVGDRLRRRRYLREYLHWIRPQSIRLVVILVMASVAGALGLVLPIGTRYIIDVVLPNRNWTALHAVGAGLVLLAAVQQTIEVTRRYWLQVVNARLTLQLRKRLFRHMLLLPLKQLQDLKVGGVISRLSGDIDATTSLVEYALLQPANAMLRVVMTIGMLLLINWQMALVAACLLPPVVVLNLLSLKRVRPIYRAVRQDRADIDARAVETFGGIRVVRAFGRERGETAAFLRGHHLVVRKNLLAHLLGQLIGAGWGLLVPLCSVVVIWYGGTRYLADEATIGDIVAFQMYVFMLLMPVSSLVRSYGRMQRGLAAMERVFDTLALPSEVPRRTGTLPAPSRVESIEFEHVGFEYEPGQPVLKDICLQVPAGFTVALVGPSGAGKTTLCDLLARFYEPTHGRILLNGTDLARIDLDDYRRLLGLVHQEVFLFDGTVRENISYSKPYAPIEAVIKAAQRANADEFICQLPDGYDTYIGERGVKLSGGQKQRLSIARAILADPQILILDEATSNLDTESERLIQESLKHLLRGRTTFVIAHRLSTITNADLIVVIENGQIMETGGHDDLILRNGRYREMLTRQLHWPTALAEGQVSP